MKIISHSQSLSLAICNKLLGIPTDFPSSPRIVKAKRNCDLLK